MLSDEYHAPAAVGGHVRIYSATELKAKLRAAGLRLAGTHHAHALHSPYWWLKCAVGVNDDDHPLVVRYRRFLEWDIVEQPRSTRLAERVLSPVLGKSLVLYGVKQAARADRRRLGDATLSAVPDLPGVLSRRRGARHRRAPGVAAGAVGHDPVVPRRPLRPVEPRRVGDGPRRRRPAPPRPRTPTSGWPTSQRPDGGVAQLLLARRQRRGGQARHQRVRLHRHRRVAPLALHVGPRRSSTTCGRPSSGRSTGCCRCAGPTASSLWAIEADGTRPWDYALLTGTSSIQHALRCGRGAVRRRRRAAPGLGRRRRRDGRRHRRPARARSSRRSAGRWTGTTRCSTGALTGEAAKARLAEGWDTFAMEGKGIRCVSDEPWVTASETAECALAYAAIGDRATATDLLRVDPRPPPRRRVVLDRPRLRRPDGAGALPVRGAHVVHRRRGGARRRRDRRRLAGVGAVHPAAVARLTRASTASSAEKSNS